MPEEIDEIQDLGKMKEVLKFLVTQEKIRQQEIEALKEMILGMDSYCKNYVDGENLNKFREKYGERLEPYSNAFKATDGQDFDIVKSAYDTYKDLDDGTISQDDYVDSVISEADKYIENIKNSLGIPEGTPVEVKDDGSGNVEVKVDEDGDGEAETTVASETASAGEGEEPTQEEIDQKSIDEAVDNYNPRR